ncbi:MAG: hypothetical protein WED00_13235 [Aquisalimonadaceae bacterium]
MKNPTRVLFWIVLFLGAVAAICAVLYVPLRDAFLANPVFNGLILTVLALGLIINIRQVLVLGPDAAWLRSYRASRVTPREPTRGVISSLIRLLTSRKDDRLSFSALSMRALLDSIRSRLDETRDLSRYIVGLLIFLGLLGTFWGLLETLSSIQGVISGLTVTGADAAGIFSELRSGLQQPLAGMGTAFSSSLFGLAGALVLGFVDLQTGHAQNRFYNDLEEWLSALTHYSSGGVGGGEGDGSVPAYIQALLEQTADSLDKLQRTLARADDERRSVDHNLIALTEQVTSLAEQSRSEQKMVLSLTKSQMEMQPVLSRLADILGARRDEEDAIRVSLQGLDQHLGRILDSLQGERNDISETLRSEIRFLARTLARHPGRDIDGER